MDKKEIFARIEYVVACVGAFAQRYNLSNMQAYAYLRRFTAVSYKHIRAHETLMNIISRIM
ncbi:MAG: DUF3791 domain-containing protein, partial [Muribaculaceae bacterium]|nr:DUF3791 domain-containing protein [Muribaculaceae bacterium]